MLNSSCYGKYEQVKCSDIIIFIRDVYIPAFQNASWKPGPFFKDVKCPESPAEKETGDYLTVSGCRAGKPTALLSMSIVLKVHYCYSYFKITFSMSCYESPYCKGYTS